MKYLIINVISFLLLLLLFIGKKNNKQIINDKKYKIIFIILLCIVIITSFYKLGLVPNGLHIDETGMYYDAQLLAKYGYDRYFNHLPVYLLNYGSGQSCLYAYLVALLIKVFGDHLILMRIPGTIFRIIAFISAYFLIKNEEDIKKRIAFLLILAITPYYIMHSRIGLDCNLMLDFIIISISAFYNSKKNIHYVLTGLLFGITLYTYALSYIIIPLFILLVILYYYKTKKMSIKQIISFIAPIVIFAIPLVLMICVNYNIINEIHTFITIPKMISFRSGEISLLNMIKNLYISIDVLLFDYVYTGTGNEYLVYNSFPYFATMFYLSIPFAILGLSVCINNIKKHIVNNLSIIILFLYISIMVCCLLIDYPNINKANPIFLPLAYFISTGIVKASNNNDKRFLIIAEIYLFMFINFFVFYYYESNNKYDNKVLFATDYLDTLDYVETIDSDTIYIFPNVSSEPDIYLKIRNGYYPTENDKKEMNINNKKYIFDYTDDIKEKYTYIVNLDDGKKIIDNNENVESKLFGNIYVITP